MQNKKIGIYSHGTSSNIVMPITLHADRRCRPLILNFNCFNQIEIQIKNHIFQSHKLFKIIKHKNENKTSVKNL